MLISLSLLLAGMLGFGLSFSLYMAIFTRFFCGIANGMTVMHNKLLSFLTGVSLRAGNWANWPAVNMIFPGCVFASQTSFCCKEVEVNNICPSLGLKLIFPPVQNIGEIPISIYNLWMQDGNLEGYSSLNYKNLMLNVVSIVLQKYVWHIIVTGIITPYRILYFTDWDI